MNCRHPSDVDSAFRWEEGDIDPRAEHFRLFHVDSPDRNIALVGPRHPVGLVVQFVGEISKSERQDLNDELWSWCTPQSDDPWFAVDLWYHLAEYALDSDPGPGQITWELVPRPTTPGSEPPFVEDVTALFRTWILVTGANLQGSEDEKRQRRERAAFLCDYVALFALVGGEPRLTVGRLARLVRLQTGEDPNAKFEVQLTGPATGSFQVRLGHIEDFDFADAWACVPFQGFVVTKLAKDATKWSRGEVRALLRHVDGSLASEVPFAGLMADTDGPRLSVRMCDES